MVWFLVVYVKQMKLQRFKDTEIVNMVKEANASGLQQNSNMKYSIVADYNTYIMACIDFNHIEFLWPPRNRHGKGRNKGHEDDEAQFSWRFQSGQRGGDGSETWRKIKCYRENCSG